MKHVHRQALRFLIAAVIISVAWLVFTLTGCAWLQTPQGSAVLTTSESIANVALSAAATTYGGPVAGQLASAGLDALGKVLQGYINKPIPPAIVKASPGVKGVGAAVQPLISSAKPVQQSDVNAVYQAAAIAAKK